MNRFEGGLGACALRVNSLTASKVNHLPCEPWLRQTVADKEVLTIWGDSKIQEELDGAVRNEVVLSALQRSSRSRDMSMTGSNIEQKSKI